MSFSNKVKTFNDSIRLSMPDTGKTLAAWQKRAIITRNAYLLIKREHDAELKHLSEIYKPDALQERIAPLNAEMEEITRIAKERMSDDLDRVMTAKREQLADCLKAPSEDAVRLLTVLNMRTTLSQSEFDSALKQLNNNIHSLRTLQDIAERNGLYCPHSVGNVDMIEKDLSVAEEFARDMIDTLDSNITGRRELAFWNYPGTSEMEYYSKLIDTNFFSSAQARETHEKEVAERKQTQLDVAAGKPMNAARVYLRGDESLGMIAMQFKVSESDIVKANPGVNLDNIKGMTPGTSIIVPSGKFSITNTPGSVIPEQVIPTWYEAKTEANEYKSGTEVDVNTI